MMATISAYALSAFFLLLFVVSVGMIFTGDVRKGPREAAVHLFLTALLGLGAYASAWLGGI